MYLFLWLQQTLYRITTKKLDVLHQLIGFVFQGNNKTFITVSAKGTDFWGKQVVPNLLETR